MMLIEFNGRYASMMGQSIGHPDRAVTSKRSYLKNADRACHLNEDGQHFFPAKQTYRVWVILALSY